MPELPKRNKATALDKKILFCALPVDPMEPIESSEKNGAVEHKKESGAVK